MKPQFRTEALTLKLPQFFAKTGSSNTGGHKAGFQFFNRNQLLVDFKLSEANCDIDFDFEYPGASAASAATDDWINNIRPYLVDVSDRMAVNRVLLAGSRATQRANVCARMVQLLGRMYPLNDQEVQKYVQRIVQAMPSDQLSDCLAREMHYVALIAGSIKSLSDSYALNTFTEQLGRGEIILEPEFQLTEEILSYKEAPRLPKSLYENEAGISADEIEVISAIANMDDIVWWHSNSANLRGKRFRINGCMDLYPDFVIKTRPGKILVVDIPAENLGDAELEYRSSVGNLWASTTDGNFQYISLSESRPNLAAQSFLSSLNEIGLH